MLFSFIKDFLINRILNRKFYFLNWLILLTNFKKKGRIKINGWKLTFNDSKALVGMYNEIIFQELYRFESQNEYPIIIDCGSNIGISVMYFYKRNPKAKITAIEADPHIADLLRKNLAENNVIAEIHQKALWKSSGELIAFGASGADEGSLFSTSHQIYVETIRLKDIICQYEYIDMLKIDIEGAEVEVLKDSKDLLSRVQNIFIEYHSFANRNQELNIILEILTQQEFKYTLIPARKIKQPFIFKGGQQVMDLQINIFGYK